jgi:hypothetical protein
MLIIALAILIFLFKITPSGAPFGYIILRPPATPREKPQAQAPQERVFNSIRLWRLPGRGHV